MLNYKKNSCHLIYLKLLRKILCNKIRLIITMLKLCIYDYSLKFVIFNLHLIKNIQIHDLSYKSKADLYVPVTRPINPNT